MKTIKFSGYECKIMKSKYMDNDNLALVLMEAGQGDLSSPVAYITVNTDEKLNPDEAYVKDYSENEGMLEAIKEAGLVEKVLGTKQLGWVTAPLVKFNMDMVAEFED